MIPFGSSEESSSGFKCFTEHFLTFYDSCAFLTHGDAIVFRRGSVKTFDHPMSSSNASNTTLTWVSAVNNTQSVSLAILALRLLQNPFLESRSRILFV